MPPFVILVTFVVHLTAISFVVHLPTVNFGAHLFGLVVHLSAPVSTSGDGGRIILCRSAPAGTIGYTESSCSTLKSITAVRDSRRAVVTASTTSDRFVTAAAHNPNASASLTKLGPDNGVAAYRLS